MNNDPVDSIFENAINTRPLIKDRQALTIDYVPEKLQFRDEETSAVAQAVSPILKGRRPSNLLLFGKPGSGKTAVVKNVTEKLIKKAKSLGSEITIVMVNAKTAKTPYRVLFEIAQKTGLNDEGRKVHFTGLSMGEATIRILEFIQRKKLHVILVIDEIDSIAGKDDGILYSFTRANEKMSEGGFVGLIGISNSLTFKEKLDPRVTSSLSEEELVFNPYTVDQLQKILADRVKIAFYDRAVSDAAINLCAAMAGRDHGDARKAINLLRVAAENAEMEGAAQVEEKHVKSAQEKIDKDLPYMALKNSTTHTKFVVLAIANAKTGNTGEVYQIYASLCKSAETDPLTQRRVTQIVNDLDLLGLVTTEVVSQGRYGRSQRMRVAVPVDKIKEALGDDPSFANALL